MGIFMGQTVRFREGSQPLTVHPPLGWNDPPTKKGTPEAPFGLYSKKKAELFLKEFGFFVKKTPGFPSFYSEIMTLFFIKCLEKQI